MSTLYRLARPALFRLPPEQAHHLGMGSLAALGRLPRTCKRLRRWVLQAAPLDMSVELAGLRLEHPVGLAAGLDKDAEAVQGLMALGFAAVEVGTVTPRPQPGNPTPRLFRLPEHQALINRMGFNNHGAEAMARRLRALSWRPAPVGINVGKNKDTPLEQAVEDYVACVEALGPLGDYLVVNASSPNTPGLRSLQQPEQLAALLQAVRARRDSAAPGKPLFLKIAPDMALEAVDEVVDVARTCKVDGIIATNTTVSRPLQHPLASEAGGLSGAPVRELSTQVIRRAWARTGGALPIVGVGGVFSGRDVYEKLRAGASLVQVYTGFVYEGPLMLRRVLAELGELLAANGFKSAREAIGSEHTGTTAAPPPSAGRPTAPGPAALE